jgi:hypothetical protein
MAMLKFFHPVFVEGMRSRSLHLRGMEALGVLLLLLAAPLRADQPMMEQTNAPAATPPVVNKVPTPTPPPAPVPPPPDTFNRYGKIWAPSDDVAHPLKLNLQFPGVGDLKIPSQEELSERDKLEQLATLSDADIRTQLDQWPPYGKMKLGDEGQMLLKIQQFKDLRTRIAQAQAHQLGLTLTPDEQARFEKDYWDKQLQMDHELAKQFEPVFKAREAKMQEELFREFSTPGTVGVPPQPPKPPPAPAPAAVAQQPPPAH